MHFPKLSSQRIDGLWGCKWHKSDDRGGFPQRRGSFLLHLRRCRLEVSGNLDFSILDLVTCLETIEPLRTLISQGSASSGMRIYLDILGRNSVSIVGNQIIWSSVWTRMIWPQVWWFVAVGVGPRGVSFSLVEPLGIHRLLRQVKGKVVRAVCGGCARLYGVKLVIVSRRKQKIAWVKRSFLIKWVFLGNGVKTLPLASVKRSCDGGEKMYLLMRIELWRSAAGWMIGLAEKGGGSIAIDSP